MKTNLIRGPSAQGLILDPEFRAEWLKLADRCPWATSFQGPDFGAAWYEYYGGRFEPLLLIAGGDGGSLGGIFPLAVARDDGRTIVAAGAWQAEYQAWVSAPEIGDEFPASAMRRLNAEFPRTTLRLLYLPPGVPCGWLSD